MNIFVLLPFFGEWRFVCISCREICIFFTSKRTKWVWRQGSARIWERRKKVWTPFRNPATLLSPSLTVFWPVFPATPPICLPPGNLLWIRHCFANARQQDFSRQKMASRSPQNSRRVNSARLNARMPRVDVVENSPTSSELISRVWWTDFTALLQCVV